MGETKARIEIEVSGRMTLTPEELWPDGVPYGWTHEDAVKLVADAGTDVISDWMLPCNVTVVTAQPNPAYAGDAVPFGDPPPAVLSDVTTVRL